MCAETIELAIPEEEDFDVSRGILTFNGEQPLLLVRPLRTAPALLQLLLPVRVRSVADPFFVAFVIHIIIVIVITIVQEDTQVSAEAEVERLSGMKFYEGAPCECPPPSALPLPSASAVWPAHTHVHSFVRSFSVVLGGA